MNLYLEFALNHYLLSAALLVVTYLLIQEFLDTAFKKFKPLSPLLAVAQMNNEESLILDVREAHEFIKGHIDGAINIPLGKINERLNQIEEYKNKPIIVVCQNGARSIPACKNLFKEGYQQLFSITGGMISWEENKLPVKITSKEKS